MFGRMDFRKEGHFPMDFRKEGHFPMDFRKEGPRKEGLHGVKDYGKEGLPTGRLS